MIKMEIPKELRSALFDSLMIQIVLGIVAGLMLDGGMCLQMWTFSMVAFWSGCVLVLARRWKIPTKMDLVMIRWGFLILCLLVTPVFSALIWRLRGVAGG
jgi:hypothetical protein